MDFELDDKTKKLFAEEKMGKLIFMMSFPVIVAVMISAIYNVVDTIFIGRSVGELGIAGISVAFPLQLMINSLGILIGLGGSSVISRALGANDAIKAKKTIGMSYFTGIALYIIVLLGTMPILNSVIYGLGANAETAIYAKEYLQYIVPGSVFILLAVSGGNLLMAQGKPELAMVQLVAGAALNLIFDPIFILVLDMGVSGAAIATIISQGLSLLIVLYFQFSKVTRITPKITDFIKVRFRVIWEIISLGIPAFLQEVGASIMIIIVNNILRGLGGAATSSLLAVFGILNKLLIFLITPLIGIAQGFMPIAGYNFGAKNFKRIKEAFKTASISTFLVTTVIVAAVIVFPETILLFFTKEAALVAVGMTPMRIMYCALPLATFSVVSAMYFMGIGKVVPSIIISLSRQVLLLIPILLILTRIFGLAGLWISFPIADALSVVISILWVKKEAQHIGFQTSL